VISLVPTRYLLTVIVLFTNREHSSQFNCLLSWSLEQTTKSSLLLFPSTLHRLPSERFKPTGADRLHRCCDTNHSEPFRSLFGKSSGQNTTCIANLFHSPSPQTFATVAFKPPSNLLNRSTIPAVVWMWLRMLLRLDIHL
jgi:hypothetical protein